MTHITFVSPGGSVTTVSAVDGSTVMKTALINDIAGIVGECGGGLVCSTCHIYVANEFLDKVSPPSDDEEMMLEAVAAERRPNSRLCCQITINPDLDGVVIELPPSQY